MRRRAIVVAVGVVLGGVGIVVEEGCGEVDHRVGLVGALVRFRIACARGVEQIG